jgi:DNA-binding GntR family transcriptional regulator
MCPSDSGGRSAGQASPEDLASAILARIAGGDLPAGTELDPAKLAPVFEASADVVEAALALLEANGATERHSRIWRVSQNRAGPSRDLMNWVAPILRAVVGLSVARITPAEAAAVLSAYDRFAGLAGDGSLAIRTDGYLDMMQGLAGASGSSFHVRTMDKLLEAAAPLVERMVTHQMATRRQAETDDDLGRLARAMMQSNPAAASLALEDHLILLTRYLDHLLPTRP